MTEGTEKKEGAGLADIAKSDFILLGAFLVFLGLISTDAYYRSFGLRFQFLSYPWNLILFRGVQTVTRFPSLLIFPILVLITLQADRSLKARISEGVRVPLFYVVALIIVFIATYRATSIGSREAAIDTVFSTSTLPKLSQVIRHEGGQNPYCERCLLLLMDSSQVVYFTGKSDKDDANSLPTTQILSRSQVDQLVTTR